MNAIEKYEFDRQGILVIKDMLSKEEAAKLAEVIDSLEEHALRHLDESPRKGCLWGFNYHASPMGYHANGRSGLGETLLIEDFFNADPAFDLLVNHPRTMSYIHNIVQG